MKESQKKEKPQSRQLNNDKTFNPVNSCAFIDNRPEAIQMKVLQQIIGNSPQIMQHKKLQAAANNYAAYLPTKKQEVHTDPAGHYAARKRSREFGFAVRHPSAALGIGQFKSGSQNISTNAVRFATNDLGLKENDSKEGSEVNAYRHALWQAEITEEYGSQIAHEAGNAHEDNPFLIHDSNRTIISFQTSAEADSSADLRNNEIGRAIGSKNSDKPMDEIAIAVIDYFHTEGLWVVEEQENGTWLVIQRKISDKEYKTARSRLLELNETGYDEEQFAERNK